MLDHVISVRVVMSRNDNDNDGDGDDDDDGGDNQAENASHESVDAGGKTWVVEGGASNYF